MKTMTQMTMLALAMGALAGCDNRPTTPTAAQQHAEADAAGSRASQELSQAGDSLSDAASASADAIAAGAEAASTSAAAAAGRAAQAVDEATDPMQRAYEEGRIQEATDGDAQLPPPIYQDGTLPEPEDRINP